MSLESIAKLADLTGVSRETVSKKIRGIPFESGHRNSKMYDSTVVLPILYDIQVETVDLNQARAKLAEKQIEKIDFDMVMKSGSFIPYDLMLAHAQRVFVAFRTRMSSIATKIAPKVAHMTDPIDIEEIVEEYVNEALEELTDLEQFIGKFKPAAVADTSGGKPKAARKANRKPVGRSASKTVA